MKSFNYLFVIVLLCFSPVQLLAQQAGEYTVEWDEQETAAVVSATTSSAKERLSFKGASFNAGNVPVFSLYLSGQSLQNVSIYPLETVAIQNKDRFFVPSTTDTVRSHVVFYKGQPTTIVTFVPLVIGANEISKVIRFKIKADEAPYSMPSRSLVTNRDFAMNNSVARTAAATSSVLSSGTWHKFPITKDGIHKLDYNYLQSLGINLSNLNSAQIHLYGNGGGMLPQPNAYTRYDDLIEKAIQVVDGGDNVFGPGDYILFYAKGPHTWTLDKTTKKFVHTYNVYSDEAYYYLNIGTPDGLRIATKASLGTGAQTFNYFDDYRFYEKDQYNVLKSGREWYGELFSVSTPSFGTSFDWPGALVDSSILLQVSVLGRSSLSTNFTVRFNQTVAGSFTVNAIPNTTYPPAGVSVLREFNITPSSSFTTADVGLTFNPGSGFTSRAHLNFLRIQGMRDLQVYGSQTNFRCKKSITQPTSTYQIQNADASLRIWDVTDSLQPMIVSYNLVGNVAEFSDQSTTLREYVCFKGTDLYTPGAGVLVPNQNLHGWVNEDLPDMVIVTHPALKAEAERLANFRMQHEFQKGITFKVKIATVDQIYNEFSSGVQDITAIRDFMKMLYEKNSATDSVRYLLLLGSCSYDYKSRVENNKNLVPCYESRNSLEQLRSFSSEDYYGFMDNNEGSWDESVKSYAMEIGVGRIPARNAEEAAVMINKIIHYQESASTQSKWKNRISFVADDGDSNIHLQDAEFMSNLVEARDKRYNLNKIYLDAYPQETAAGGEKSPIVKDLITKELDKGIFVLNYSGHGGTGAWAQELILDLPMVEGLKNIDALPLWITATCDFGLYDDPATHSGTDAVLFNANGGGIGIVTSTRIVFQYSNRKLNEELYKVLFKSYGTDYFPRMGDVFKLTKNNSYDSFDINNRNYAFLGDPSMQLAYPRESIAITKINGAAVSSVADTLKALSKVTIEGEVRDQSNTVINSYSGTASITCFDKKNSVNTLGTQSNVVNFKLLNNVFFEGKVSIDSGKFKVTFVVPKDIAFLYDKGKISIYGQNNSELKDASGYYDNIQIGGANASAPADNTPPEISLYLNDESFVSGGLTNNNPLFLAKVKDDNGINVGTGGIGHEITITMSNKPDVIILNEYYSTDVNTYSEGSVRYPIKDLPAGNYSLKFKVWDTYNNSSERTLEFVVANTDKMALDHVLNYPNPFSTHTDFHFDHNRAGDDIEVLIQIYTVSGKMIKSLEQTSFGSPIHVSGLIWDGRDDFGDKIGKGVYVYKIKVRSLRDGSTTHQFQKLVLLN